MSLVLFEPQVSCASLPTEELASIVIGAFTKIREVLPYVLELRKRFADAPKGKAGIAGCNTWEEFCGKHLHRTPSALRLAFQTADVENPAAKFAPASNRKLKRIAFKAQHPEFENRSNKEVDSAIHKAGFILPSPVTQVADSTSSAPLQDSERYAYGFDWTEVHWASGAHGVACGRQNTGKHILKVTKDLS